MTRSRRDRWLDDVATDLVEYLIIAIPDLRSLARVVPALAELIRADMMRILDLVVLVRDRDGTVDVLELESIETVAALRDVEGDLGGLLTHKDLELASFAIRPGAAGIVLLAEDRWAKPLSLAARRAGGQIVAGERIPAARIEAVFAEDLGDH